MTLKVCCFPLVMCFGIIFLGSQPVWAWGKRGHETVGSLAARLLAEKHSGSEFLIHHTYDMGYYNNVPDLVWKAVPKTFKKEFPQHFMDLEAYSKIPQGEWTENRKDFFKKHPKIPLDAGRAWWRVHELAIDCKDIAQQLKKTGLKQKEQHKLQARWLLTAGVLGHYIADLAQPLHVTENYDGQKNKQRGVHKWFEEHALDHLYPEIHKMVYEKMKSEWEIFHKENEKQSVFELSRKLSENSFKKIEELLKKDKELGRSDTSKFSMAMKDLAVERLALGGLYLAEIWSRSTGWKYDGEKFFIFQSSPQYLEPTPE